MALSAGPSRPQEPLSRHAKPGPRGSPTRRARRHGGAGEARASQNEVRRRAGRGPCNRFSHTNPEIASAWDFVSRVRASPGGGAGGSPLPSGPHRDHTGTRLYDLYSVGNRMIEPDRLGCWPPLHAHRVVVWIPRRLRGALPLDVGTNSVSGARTPITRYGSHNGGTRMRPNERGPRDAANARGRGSGGVAPPRRHRDRHLRALRRSVVTNCS